MTDEEFRSTSLQGLHSIPDCHNLQNQFIEVYPIKIHCSVLSNKFQFQCKSQRLPNPTNEKTALEFQELGYVPDLKACMYSSATISHPCLI